MKTKLHVSVDLNCDLGESYGRFVIGNDDAIMPHITSCNIACGFHGGDPLTMEHTILLALQHNVSIGAHPGFPDLQGFGRRTMQIPPAELKSMVKYQISALQGMTRSLGGRLRHVKPHGALYNLAAVDTTVAEALIQAIREIDENLILVGPSMNTMETTARTAGLRYGSEVFADRNYTDDLTLVSRTKPNAMITETTVAVAHVLQMVTRGKVKTESGNELAIKADTICIHGDQPKAPEFANALRDELRSAKIQIAPLEYEG